MDKLTKYIFDCAENNKIDLTLNFAKDISNSVYKFIIIRFQKDGYMEIPEFGKIYL
jgi:hypothetical protein